MKKIKSKEYSTYMGNSTFGDDLEIPKKVSDACEKSTEIVEIAVVVKHTFKTDYNELKLFTKIFGKIGACLLALLLCVFTIMAIVEKLTINYSFGLFVYMFSAFLCLLVAPLFIMLKTRDAFDNKKELMTAKETISYNSYGKVKDRPESPLEYWLDRRTIYIGAPFMVTHPIFAVSVPTLLYSLYVVLGSPIFALCSLAWTMIFAIITNFAVNAFTAFPKNNILKIAMRDISSCKPYTRTKMLVNFGQDLIEQTVYKPALCLIELTKTITSLVDSDFIGDACPNSVGGVPINSFADVVEVFQPKYGEPALHYLSRKLNAAILSELCDTEKPLDTTNIHAVFEEILLYSKSISDACSVYEDHMRYNGFKNIAPDKPEFAGFDDFMSQLACAYCGTLSELSIRPIDGCFRIFNKVFANSVSKTKNAVKSLGIESKKRFIAEGLTELRSEYNDIIISAIHDTKPFAEEYTTSVPNNETTKLNLNSDTILWRSIK